MRSPGILLLLAALPESPLHLAWRHTGVIWAQVGATISHHPVVLFVCAAVPAIERVFAYLNPGVLSRGRAALLEALVTLWRVLLFAVVIWAATSGVEWQQLRRHAPATTAWQIALDQLGAHQAHHLRMILWELVFLAVVLLIAYQIILWCVQALGRTAPWLGEPRHRAAVMSVVRNLIFAPLILLYLVEMARPGLQ